MTCQNSYHRLPSVFNKILNSSRQIKAEKKTPQRLKQTPDVERGVDAAEVSADRAGRGSCLPSLCRGLKQTVSHTCT